MKKIFLFSFFLVLIGCASKSYVNNNINADWDRDNFMCRSYAEGNTPMPQMVPVPQAETVTGAGTIYYNNGQSVPFTYTETYQPNQYQQLGAEMQNAAASWGRIAMLQSRYESCLAHLGWYESKETRTQNTKNKMNGIDFPDNRNDIEKYKKLANEGDIDAQVALGLAYLYGRGLYANTIKESRKIAYTWFALAATKGNNKIAQYEIGIAYISGEDLEKDVAEGKKYIQLSAAQGYQPAIDTLAEIEKNN